MTLSSGSRLGPYEIVAPLGVGGMGEVYRAWDTRLDRVVVTPLVVCRGTAALRAGGEDDLALRSRKTDLGFGVRQFALTGGFRVKTATAK